jgi:hypothetical protein
MNREMTEREMLLQIIQDQIRRHPGFYIRDLYKMVYQATCGGSHLLLNSDEVKKNLQKEWDQTERIPKGESLLEVIDPRCEVMRVNIRIYKKIGGTPVHLLRIFKQSVKSFPKDKNRFIATWEMAMDLAEDSEIPFSRSLLEDFLIEQGKNDLPAVHHSDQYIESNRPSYRIVLKKLWEGL